MLVTLTDSLVENPFGTANGQTTVSEEENFWSRKLRYGRTAFKLWDDISLATAGTAVKVIDFSPKVNKIFIPSTFNHGSDTDCKIMLQYIPYLDYANYDPSFSSEYLLNTIVAAKTPFVFKFDGQIEVAYGGNIFAWVTPLTTAGKSYGVIHGIEVSARA